MTHLDYPSHTSLPYYRFFNDGGSLASQDLINAPIVKNVEIASTEPHVLFTVPHAIQGVSFEGFFDATTPNLAVANFDITINGFEGGVSEFTIFEPTIPSFYVTSQYTELGSSVRLDDNIDSFSNTTPFLEPDGSGGLQFYNVSPPVGYIPDNPLGYQTLLRNQTLPEPLTILGAGTAITFGASIKRKLAKGKKK